MTAAAALRTQIRPPRLALLPAATPPRGGLLLSVLVHAAAIFALITWLPLLFPGRSITASRTSTDILHDPNEQVLMLPVLHRLTDMGSRSNLVRELRKIERSSVKAKFRAGRPTSNPLEPDYAAPQIVVSNPPEWTNHVQTIIRPDLLAPPKLKFPIRLPSMVDLPAPTATARVVPQLEQPSIPNAARLVPFQASQPRAQVPVLPMGAPKQSSALPAELAVPKIVSAFDRSLPAFPRPAVPEPTATKAVVVLSAVSVPSESAAAIPDGELSGSFVVGPSRPKNTDKAGSAESDGNPAGASNARENSSNSGREYRSPVGTGVDAASGALVGEDAAAGNAPAGGAGVGAQLGSSGGTSIGTQSAQLPGISISGGISERGGRAIAATSISRSYGITIISGGSSGGASRDLGVFSRTDTIYTVYIPMGDAGGGLDWPMEYALMGSAPAGNGLLMPPVVVRKIQAIGSNTDPGSNSGTVFIAGVIDENGKLKALRAIHALDAKAQAAVSALSQWEFLPAQLDGKPVASKVMIGVSVMPSRAVAKQN